MRELILPKRVWGLHYVSTPSGIPDCSMIKSKLPGMQKLQRLGEVEHIPASKPYKKPWCMETPPSDGLARSPDSVIISYKSSKFMNGNQSHIQFIRSGLFFKFQVLDEPFYIPDVATTKTPNSGI